VVTVLWSSSWVLIRVGLDDIDAPVLLAGVRYGLASTMLGAWLRLRPTTPRPVPTPPRRATPYAALALLGVVQYAVTQGAQFVAIDHQPFASTSLLLAATPLLVAIAGPVIGEATQRRQLIAGIAILAGVAVYFGGDLGGTPAGMAAASVALVANALSVLAGRRLLARTHLSATHVTVVTMGIGATVLLVAGVILARSGGESVRWTPTAIAVVAWLAAVNTAAAFTWWNVALRRLPAAEMATINTTMAVQIPVLGWIFFGEALGAAELLGLAVVVVAVAAATRPPGRTPLGVTR